MVAYFHDWAVFGAEDEENQAKKLEIGRGFLRG